MNRSHRFVWVTAAAIGFGVISGLVWTQREPRFEGRSVSEWLDAYAVADERPTTSVLRVTGPRQLRDAQTLRPLKDLELEAFVSMGTAAVPALARHVRTGFFDSDRYLKVLAKLPPRAVELFPSPWRRATRRYHATEILLSLGPAAKSAVPALVGGLTSTNSSGSGPIPMGVAIGTTVPLRPFRPQLLLFERERLVEAVCTICGDRQGLEPVLLDIGRRGHFRTLVDLAAAGGWQGPEVAGLLAAAQNDPDPEVRAAAMRLLESAPNLVPRVLNSVLSALKDPDETVRWLAARTIEASSARESEVIAALQMATNDSNAMVRTVTRRTLEKSPNPP
ncbi:MAG: HEAT repeat domain-containing protein [Verrucomicrobiae bacterium]|nr:HEAT repeat domain-containing protein [Verrucomicrobiae bacterium]